MRSTNYIKGLILLIATFAVFLVKAQEAVAPLSPPPATPSSPGSYSMYMLLGTAIILLLIIAVLGQVLIRLTLYVYENKSKVVKSVLLFLILAICGHSLSAQDAAASAAPVAAKAAGSTSDGFSMDLIIALTVVLTEVFVICVLLVRILSLINIISPRAQVGKQWFGGFNKSVAAGHDRTKESGNQLPSWSKWGFALIIIGAVGYFSYYRIFHAGTLSGKAHTNEVAEAKVAKDADVKPAKNTVDENTIVFDASYVADGQKLFSANCAPCHGPKGEGVVGPNLTDNYWLHGGKINDIFKTIKYGWPDKGMISWQANFSAIQIAQLSCYVISLKGTNPPNGKEPQGDLYTGDDGAKNATASAPGK
jgi:cytochrome c oxidase cbb3-type subunit 3